MEELPNMNPGLEVQKKILADKMDNAKAERYSTILSAQAAQEIGNEKEVKRLQDAVASMTKAFIFYQKKLKELETPGE